MDNFNLQKFVKESKNEFYTNLYEGKKKDSMEEEMHDDDHKMEEKMHDKDHKMEGEGHDEDHKMEENHQSLDKEVADRIEGLLRIPLKAKFLATGFDLINDLLEDDEFDVADIVSHLANELERMYYKASKPSFYGGLEEGEEEEEVESGVTQDSIDMAMSQAGMVEQEDEEVESVAGVEDTMEMPTEIPTEETDNKEVFSQLVDAYEAAKELGDEKLTRQLANTITYFNKTIIFGDEE